MLVAAVQFTSGADLERNQETILASISEAAEKGARLIVLPEASTQAFATGRLDTQAQPLDGPFATAVQARAEELGVTVIVGMFCPADTVQRGDKTIHRVDNTALITGPGIHTGYRKIHTYDAFDYAESDTVRPGEDLVVFDVDGVKVGVAVCYDIRFPQQFKDLARQGAEVIAVPFSWADGKGKLEQWQLVSAARALDSTAYIVAAGQALPPADSKGAGKGLPTGIGHSAIIAPTGQRLAEAGFGPEIIYAEIDSEQVASVRRALPVLAAD